MRVQGRAFGAKVQKVQRVVVAADAAIKKGATGCVEGLWKKVLKIDRPDGRRVLKFDGAFGPEGCGIALWGRRAARVQKVQRVRPAFGKLVQRVAVSPFRAMSMKSALRAYLAVSYGVISILVIGSLCSPPPIRLRRTSPRESVSHDSQVALLPYESCSPATPVQGAE